MTDKQLKRGQELKSEIENLNRRIAYWNNADFILTVSIHCPVSYPSGGNDYLDDGKYVNFHVLKTLTLQAMRTELEKLEKEYREL